MWGYAIFCEYPGCQRFEAVSVEDEIPAGWLSVEAGPLDIAHEDPDSVGTYCGWSHMLQGLLQLAPEDTEFALDIRHRPVEPTPSPPGVAVRTSRPDVGPIFELGHG